MHSYNKLEEITTKQLLDFLYEDLLELKDIDFDRSDIHEHFLAAIEMINRVGLFHMSSDGDGRTVVQKIGSCADSDLTELDSLNLDDGELIAYAPVGKYTAPRAKGFIEFY